MKKYLFTFVLSLFLLTPSLASASQFDPLSKTCEGNSDSAICQENAQGDDPVTGADGVIVTAGNIVAGVTAIIAVVVIIVAGITMTLSGGDSSKVQKSRDAIIYAAIGLVVVALARAIVVFVGRSV